MLSPFETKQKSSFAPTQLKPGTKKTEQGANISAGYKKGLIN
jgi:hypothetical protein